MLITKFFGRRKIVPISIQESIENKNKDFWQDEIEAIKVVVKKNQFERLDYKLKLTEVRPQSPTGDGQTTHVSYKLQIENVKNTRKKEYESNQLPADFEKDLLNGEYDD